MLTLVSGLALFIAAHVIPTMPDVRAGLRQRFGNTGYQVLFSVASLVGLAVLVLGWRQLAQSGGNPQIWYPPVWTRHIALLLMLPAMVLLVAAYVPSRIRSRLKHPMLTAVKVWALAHLLANGDLAGMIVFGSILAYAVYDRISLKRRPAGSGLGPLGAKTGGVSGDILAVVLGVALYAVLVLGGHYYLFGVAPLPKFSFAP